MFPLARLDGVDEATLAVLALIGEFVIRNFGTLQRKPAYVIRELLRR